MSPKTDMLERAIHRFALGLALLVGLLLPTAYFAVSYQDLSESLTFKARVKASALSGLIASHPELWMFAENRIQGLIWREPVPLNGELVQVLDKDGSIITQTGDKPRAPVLRKTALLYDAGNEAGQIAIYGSMADITRITLLSALLSSILALIVYLVMRVLPLRALKAVTDALHKEKERAETTLHSIGDAVVTTDADGSINYLNPAAERLLGCLLKRARGQHVAAVVHLHNAEGGVVESSLHQALKTNTIVDGQKDCELRRADGTTIAIEERAAPINDRNGRVAGGVLILRDVSVARAYVQRRSWEATHDALTNLCNRREFENRLSLALAEAQEVGHLHVLCYMDLDRFKAVNDSCGHAAGDELLIQLTRLMQARIRDTDTLARLGGDEFGLLLMGCDEKRGKLIATDIMAAVNDFNFVWGNKVMTVGVSIGLTVITRNHNSVAEIVGEADCACYWAKEQGKNRVLVFVDSDMNLAARRSETGWVGRINDAFKNHRFVLYFQNYRMLDAQASHNDHLEILLRMIGEDGEVIAPGRFLPAAERYNLMPDIDHWVIHEVFSRYHELVQSHNGNPLTCAINLSGATINSEGLLDYIRKQSHEYHLVPGSICFELTETVALNNLEAATGFIRDCKELGFQCALDHFGGGKNAFGYLKNLPVDYLKIDGSFVRNIEHDRIDHAMVETINHIGHLLGKRTVAEFAETEVIIDQLGSIGVDFAQGYGVCHPLPLFA